MRVEELGPQFIQAEESDQAGEDGDGSAGPKGVERQSLGQAKKPHEERLFGVVEGVKGGAFVDLAPAPVEVIGLVHEDGEKSEIGETGNKEN